MIGRADIFVACLTQTTAAPLRLDLWQLLDTHPGLTVCSFERCADPHDVNKGRNPLMWEVDRSLFRGPRTGFGGLPIDVFTNCLSAYTTIRSVIARRDHSYPIIIPRNGKFEEWLALPLLHYQLAGRAPEPFGRSHPLIAVAPYGLYASGDGSIVLIAVQEQCEWARFCREILGGLADPRFDEISGRVAHRAALDAAIGACLQRYDGAALRLALDRAGIAYAVLNDLAAHPELTTRTVEAANGPVVLPWPSRRNRAVPQPRRPVPALNQQGAALRNEFA
jgi:itaconate CoA-transferase